MDNISKVFAGRTFSQEDIEIIKWARKRYPKLSRRELAGTVCEILNWTTPAGRAKIKQCLDFLEILEADGIVQLPAIQTFMQRKQKVYIPEIKFKTEEIDGDIQEYEPIQLVKATPGEELKRWRSYVNQYHMLGDKWVFGSRLQYFVKSGDKELGCLQFSASAWSLADRDQWIGWTQEDRKVRLHLIVNNSRFLIFPGVHIRNLASKALSLAVKQIQQDWLREYCYAPVLLETFVDTEHFKGTCYKASNWIYLGETKGSGRSGVKEGLVSRKTIFMYPLQKNFKACLRGEEPYKVVDPDEQV
ncbi:MAG: DUF4338 domain-containing protein [Desulfitobacteriaceae bacterium]|nr:DUF4338 domain-containing protein [Desulfitobacteriaceae bacterium]MDI6915670.1 DUF4338 domain-containing protein [Desulfitobacteriaceae bacterium]